MTNQAEQFDRAARAAAVLNRRLGCALAYSRELAELLNVDEVGALLALPDDPAVDAAVRVIVESARMRKTLEPLIVCVLETFSALEIDEREVAELATRFSTAGGETQLDRAIEAGDHAEVIGPRRSASIDPRHRRLRRSIGDGN